MVAWCLHWLLVCTAEGEQTAAEAVRSERARSAAQHTLAVTARTTREQRRAADKQKKGRPTLAAYAPAHLAG